ncbi:MAG: hypothetical protein EOO04_36725 [Chitinophagaceae bacterium]|nr:MAG: hypothetical protein EOO04_36725 [Chitinophagaceae bacterium]
MEGFAVADKPAIDIITARSTSKNSIYVTLLNNSAAATEFALKLDESKIGDLKNVSGLKWIDSDELVTTKKITIPPFGLKTLEVKN